MLPEKISVMPMWLIKALGLFIPVLERDAGNDVSV